MDKLFPYANVLFETYNIKKNDDMEKEENTVSYRLHGEQKTTTVSLDEFVEKVKTQIATKALEIN